MTEFKDIEQEYLTMGTDDESLRVFYIKHKEYFYNYLPPDKDDQLVLMELLSEIGCFYSLSGEPQEAYNVLKRVIEYFESINADNQENSTYNSTLFSFALTNFEMKRYSKALKCMRIYISDKSKENEKELIIHLFKTKLKNRTLWRMGITGIVLSIIKYMILWFYPEHHSPAIQILGIVGLLMVFSFLFIKKPEIPENSRSIKNDS